MDRIIGLTRQEESREDWRAKVDHLERCVCELLLKNQTLRMALLVERTGGQSYVDLGDLPANPTVGFGR
jgi:hypothetical protein